MMFAGWRGAGKSFGRLDVAVVGVRRANAGIGYSGTVVEADRLGS